MHLSLRRAVTTLGLVILAGAAGTLGTTAADASPTRQAPAPTCGAPVYKASGGAWTCTFDDEFSGTTLDTTKWQPIKTADYGYHSGPECFVNNSSNIAVSNGTLKLTVRDTGKAFTCASPSGNYSTRYTSGSITTANKFSQTYGRFSVRAKFPAATVAGLQSSLWLWPQKPIAGLTWPTTGEIDIAEEYSQYPDRAIPYLHYTYDNTLITPDSLLPTTNVVTNNYCMITDVTAFHEYVLEWTPTTLTISFDGQNCVTDTYSSLLGGSAPFNSPFYINLTQALGIGTNAFDPATTPLPATTEVDWVRAWK